MEPNSGKDKISHYEQLVEYQEEIKKSGEDFDKILQILHRMSEIPVTIEDLSKSEVGKTLKKLTKVHDKPVNKFAEDLISKWKKVIKNSKEHHHNPASKPQTASNTKNVEKTPSDNSSKQSTSPNPPAQKPQTVKPTISKNASKSLEDKSQEPYRNKMKSLLYNGISKFIKPPYTEQEVISKIIKIEEKMNELLEKGTKYTNRGRAIYANLHDPKNEDFRKNILNGSLSEETIVTMDVKEMANQKLKSEREKLEKDIFNSLRTDWNDEHQPVFEGMYTCEKCKGRRTQSKEIQMRSADEPMTIFLRCIDCGNEWRIG